MKADDIPLALTFDDVLLRPAMSEILPKDVDLSSRLTKGLSLRIPLMSAAMDTVTEARMSIAMAQDGGIGIIHKNMSPQLQAKEVIKVKKSESGMIIDPITVKPDQKISHALDIMKEYRISGLPVVDERGRAVGIVTNRDLRFETNFEKPIFEVMTSENLVTVPSGTMLEEAKALLHKYRIEKLLVVDPDGMLRGLLTIKDIEKSRKYPFASKDSFGRLRTGAAVGVGPDLDERLERLVAAEVDVIAVDSAHGHSRGVLEVIKKVRLQYPDLEVIGGNVATRQGAKALLDAGVHSVKVGMGPGSICTTRIVSGVGVPQISAILEVASVLKGTGISLIADGGIRYSGDIVKALAAGADVVMIGSLFAGTEEAPGDLVLYQGRSYKFYRGMGAIGAMKRGSRDRYFQGEEVDDAKLVPEGIEGRVPFKGSVASSIYQMLGGIRAGMGYLGANNVQELQMKAEMVRITSAGLGESHVHNVAITEEAPNYSVRK